MRCCVPSCDRIIPDVEHGISSHRFPSDFERRVVWMRAIATANPNVLQTELNLAGVRICSGHFTPDCFVTIRNSANRISLFASAVPSIFKSEPKSGRRAPQEADILHWMEKNPTNEKIIQKTKIPRVGIHTDTQKTGTEFSREQLVGVVPKIQKRYLQSQKVVKALRVQNMRLRNRLTQLEQLVEKKSAVKSQPQEMVQPENSTSAEGHCSCCQNATRKESQTSQPQAKKARLTQAEGPEASTKFQPTPIPLGQDHCRLCFRKENLEPLCSGTIVSRDEMLEKIYVCTGILIVPRPSERSFICESCEEFVSNFHTFRQQISSNNRAMKMAVRWKTQVTSLKGHTVGSQPNTATKPSVPLPPQTKYRKVIKKPPVEIVQPSGNTGVIVKQPLIKPPKTEPIDDPLAGCGGLSRAGSPPPKFPVMPKPFVIVKRPVPVKRKLPPGKPIPIRNVAPLPVPSQRIQPEVVNDLPEQEEEEQESFKCWNCDSSFRFKFECAKHLLLVHREDVPSIKERLKLDELNSNMLEVMSEKHKVQNV